jgi:hypothetical protein
VLCQAMQGFPSRYMHLFITSCQSRTPKTLCNNPAVWKPTQHCTGTAHTHKTRHHVLPCDSSEHPTAQAHPPCSRIAHRPPTDQLMYQPWQVLRGLPDSPCAAASRPQPTLTWPGCT